MASYGGSGACIRFFGEPGCRRGRSGSVSGRGAIAAVIISGGGDGGSGGGGGGGADVFFVSATLVDAAREDVTMASKGPRRAPWAKEESKLLATTTTTFNPGPGFVRWF